jgi:peroxiredoxin
VHGGRALKVVSELPPIEELTPPHNDGAAAHLPGVQLPAIELPSTEGGCVALSDLVALTVVFVLPSIGGIDGSLLEEWTAIPGARGSTAEACGFRDRLHSFRSARVDVLGLSGQPGWQQRDAVERWRLPYPLLSDEQLQLAASLGLPTLEFHSQTYLKRVTLVVSQRRVEAALYPVFPPDQAAEQALAWLAENSSA